MKTFRLVDFADEGVLDDLDTASFLNKKLGSENHLDFTDISGVDQLFLDTLLEGQTIEGLDGRIIGLSESIDKSLEEWVDRQKKHDSPTIKPKKDKTKPKVVKAQPMEYEKPEPEGERFTPSRLVTRLRRQLTGYIESAYPLSDPILVRSRRRLLEEVHDGHLLAQEPYVESTPKYKLFNGGYDDLNIPNHIASLFSNLSATHQEHTDPKSPRTILYPGMYEHQAESYRKFLCDGKDIIVATGTGSGKTECFLLPMLGSLYDEAFSRKESWTKPGVRTIILYPMNALVNDQLSRLRLLFGDVHVAKAFHDLGQDHRHPTFGMYTGRTPYPGPRDSNKDRERVRPLLEYYLNDMDDELKSQLKRLGRYPAKDLESFYAKHLEIQKTYKTGKKKGGERTEYNWPKRLHTHHSDRELLVRQEMVKGSGSLPGNCPDILITNYSMLEYMLMRPFERPIFAQTAEWLKEKGNQLLLVLDEAHMYRGAKGAEVAFLLRRLQARLGIHDQSEKLRIICTSASLGKSDESLDNICRFAADLTGKKPDFFVPVVGERSIPGAVETGNDEVADLLAAIDLDHLHASASSEDLRNTLTPLFEYFGMPCVQCSEDELLGHLYQVLNGRPFINLLLEKTAGEARGLSSLADTLFPNHLKRIKATEVLITLGTIARLQKDEPGLIPTRVHIFFRGLSAIYACINPKCSGRQNSPGDPSLLGKLFVEPRVCCDVCGSRVFEMASCRSCGSPYINAYAREEDIAELDFLWGEMEGALNRIELLPAIPRHEDSTEEIRVHLTTGYLDREQKFPDEDVRSFWLSLDKDGKREQKFNRCAMCQPPGSRARSHINNFRTKGEQPFTVLIDAQFAEQPPQKADKRLPNRGRKVLVFSDGRQKAARLAPALEYSHARDLFRQVLALASSELVNQTKYSGMDKLYPALLWVCNKRGINLFPGQDDSEFDDHLKRSKGKELKDLINDSSLVGYMTPTMTYARALFDEMTDRYYSLNSLALATIEEDPAVRSFFKDFPSVGLSEEEALVIFRSWLRLQLEARRFLPHGADISKLGEGWEKPEGIQPDNLAQLFPRPFEEYLKRILNDEKQFKEVVAWYKNFVRTKGICKFENNLYFLRPLGLSLVLKLDAAWLYCRDCGRTHSQTISNICPACLGEIVEVDPDYLDARNGYYRQQLQRAMSETSLEPFGLISAEHSAQLTGMDNQEAYSKTEKYELRFQDIPIEKSGAGTQAELPIDVLSCTTTMEVGIDIGTLSGVALRNVPPHVANYQQRAGRAGRRGRSIASVITYAHGTSHDSYYYENPANIITGDVLPPIVYIENQQVLHRHINAYLIQRFFHESVQEGSEIFRLFESLGTVEQFLSDEYPCSLRKLEEWLKQRTDSLRQELEQWAPEFSFGLGGILIPDVEKTVETAIDALLKDLYGTLPVEDYLRREQLDGVAREVLERRLEEGLLATLINRAIFPRYAFPTDVVGFWVSKPKRTGDPIYKRDFEYEPQRDLQIALSEYAPGASLTIDKYRFSSAALFSPYSPDVDTILNRARSYTACKACGYVSLHESSLGEISCPCCGSDELFKQSFITPQGFAPDINDKKEIDRGEAPDISGQASRAQLEVQESPTQWDAEYCDGRIAVIAGPRNLVTVNKGIGDRGFLICPNCGRAEPVFGKGYPNSVMFKGGVPRQHPHPLEQGLFCDGRAVGPFYLGHSFLTDVMLLRVRVNEPVLCSVADTPERSGRPGRAALTSLVEALCLAASNKLQIEEGELSGNWCPVLGGDGNEVQVFLYDLLPGGAGYTRLVRDNLDTVLKETERLLLGCSCETSCYNCIRHYSNNFLHPSLDRKLALALLQNLRSGVIPSLTYDESSAALSPLVDLLRLQGYSALRDQKRDGIMIPLIIQRLGGSEIWIQAHHPLINEPSLPSLIKSAAETAFVEFCSIDSFMLSHDLPAAYSKLQL